MKMPKAQKPVKTISQSKPPKQPRKKAESGQVKQKSKTIGQTTPAQPEVVPVTQPIPVIEKVDLTAEAETVTVAAPERKISKTDTAIAAVLLIGVPVLLYMLISGM